jgi:DNA repair exonuclease SbcCD ATPase subunit
MNKTSAVTLGGVTLSKFRAFPGTYHLPLGRITVVSGNNGLGKTTLFDAIDWGLFGDTWRLGHEDEQCVRNLWATDAPQVVVHTSEGDVVRTSDNAMIAGAKFEATRYAVDPSIYSRPNDGANALRRLAYLPQHEIRQLVEGTKETRAFLLAALAGVPFADRFSRNVQNTHADIRARLKTLETERTRLAVRQTEIVERLERFHSARSSRDRLLLEVSALLKISPPPANLGEAAHRVAQHQSNLRSRATETELELRRMEARHLRLNHAGIALASMEKESARDLAQRDAAEATEREIVALADEAISNRVVVVKQIESEEHSIIRLTTDIERVRTKSALRRRYESLRERQTSLVHEISRAGASLASARQKAAEAAARLADVQVAHRASTNELAAVNELQSTLSAGESELRAQQAALKAVEQEWSATSQAIAGVRAEHDRTMAILVSARDEASYARLQSERLDVLLQELASLPDLGDGVCPLCSHDHGTAVRFRERVEQTLAEMRERSARVRRIELLDAEVQKQSVLLRSLDEKFDLTVRKREESKAAQERSEARVAAATNALARLDVGTLTARVDETRASVSEKQQAAERQALAVDKLTGEHEALLTELPSVEAALSSIQISDHDTSQDTAQEELKLEVANGRLAQLRTSLGEFDSKLATLRARGHEIAEQLAQIRSRLANEAVEREVLGRQIQSITEELRAVLTEVTLGSVEAEIVRMKRVLQETDSAITLTTDLKSGISAAMDAEEAISEGLEGELGEVATQIAELEEKYNEANRADQRLRAISSHVGAKVDRELQEAERRARKTIDAIMQILSPHRHLSRVRISSEGDILLRDNDLSEDVPARLYSSAGQINCIALAVFFAMASSTATSRLRCLLLDEPVQNLDDVNLLNFIELVRHVARSHQVILSTANANLAELLEVKLGLWAAAENQEVVMHEFMDFDRADGPRLKTKISLLDAGAAPAFRTLKPVAAEP